MKLRAKVKHVKGVTRHYLAHIEGDKVCRDEEFTTPEWVEIQPSDGSFLLLYLNGKNEYLTDTWHQTIEQAKEQAQYEFNINEDDWELILS